MSVALTLSPQRDNQIDTIKFLLIFSIYIYHIGTRAGNFYPFVNIYQVPIFFIISGFWALNRIDKSPWQFVCNAFKKYLIFWLIWVFIYTAYYTIENSLALSKAIEKFILYFSGIKATGIAGMWFTPAFFITSFIYYLFAKGMSAIFKFSKQTIAWLGFAIFFIIYFITTYWVQLPSLIFSLKFVPECLLYFSLGTVIYIYIQACKPLMKTSFILRLSNCVLTLFSCGYFLLYFFKKEKILWSWTTTALGGKLSFLPTLVTVLLMFFLISSIAKCISCDFTAKIGKNTLGLCHCEMFTKGMFMYTCSLLGLNFKLTKPIEAIIFAFVTLIISCYVILPVSDIITKRILSVNKK